MSIDLGGQLHEQDARGKPQLYEGREMRIGGGEGTIPSNSTKAVEGQRDWIIRRIGKGCDRS